MVAAGRLELAGPADKIEKQGQGVLVDSDVGADPREYLLPAHASQRCQQVGK